MKQHLPLALLVTALSMGGNLGKASSTEELLSTNGVWKTYHRTDQVNGTRSCVVESTNSEGQVFSILTTDMRGALAYVHDESMFIPTGPTELEIFMNGTRFSISGRSMETSVGFFLQYVRGGWETEFLKAFGAGRRIRIRVEQHNREIYFSLEGSSSAMLSFFQCQETLN